MSSICRRRCDWLATPTARLRAKPICRSRSTAVSYNILLADIADAAALQARFESSASRVVIVPVLYKPTKAEAAEAAKQGRFLIKAPGRAAQYLTTIAEAVASRGATPRKG